MDRFQLVNDTEVAIRYGLDGRQATIWTAMPALVQSVDLTAMTIEAQPAIQGIITSADGSTKPVNLPILADVPICFPSAGGVSLTLPIEVGDEVLIIIASRCIDAWWQQGGVQPPIEMRMHDLSDGFAVPGPRSQPNVLPNISSDAAQLRNDAGTLYFGVNKTTGLLQAASPTQTLSGVLNSLLSIESSINTALITFATGLNPGTVTAKGAALAATLATVTASISTAITNVGELLE